MKRYVPPDDHSRKKALRPTLSLQKNSSANLVQAEWDIYYILEWGLGFFYFSFFLISWGGADLYIGRFSINTI
jgi:hypothetical protein